MVRALSLAPLLSLYACSVDLGIEQMRYRCDDDSECAAGFACDRVLRICADPSDAGTPDSGAARCGFDETFAAEEPADWQRNGSASLRPGFVELTPPESNRRGTLWHTRRILAERFSYEMAFSISGAGEEGGEGMTMAWIEEGASARGGGAANLAVYGLTGWIVELDTFANIGTDDPPEEHIAFARARGDLRPSVELHGTATALPSLRSQRERVLRLDFDRDTARIFLDGALVLTATVPDYQPFEATFGATAATSARVDSHAVHRLTLTCM